MPRRLLVAALVLMAIVLIACAGRAQPGAPEEPRGGAATRGTRRVPVEGVDQATDYHAKYAIIVGIDDYSPGEGFAHLQNAANDAREFRQLLVEDFGYDDQHILYLTDAEGEPGGIVDGRPTRAAIRDAFGTWLPGRNSRPDDSVLVFFAGHGIYDDGSSAAYIAASDSKADAPECTCIRVGWIRDRLGDANSVACRHKLVLLDSCFSGGLFMFSQPLAARPATQATPKDSATQGGAGAGPALAMRGGGAGSGRGGDEVGYYLRGEAYLGMTAGLGDQPVADGTGEDRHSLFTKALLQAMRDRANWLFRF